METSVNVNFYRAAMMNFVDMRFTGSTKCRVKLITMKNEDTIEGVIKDAGGNPIANATVTLSNGMTTATDTKGHFSFENVLSGKYTLNATKAGLEPITQNVSASAGQTSELGALSALASPSTTISDNGLIIGAAAVLIVALLLLFLVFIRRRKKEE
ncbi:MAG: carboxypeptidase-like regulatory domain-containing protein [Methanomassiliicoccales archaeon]